MSIRSHLAELAELTLNWQGQALLLSDVKGLVCCREGGKIEFLPRAQMHEISSDWVAILEFERAHGWLSIRHVQGASVMCLNGHILTKSPLLIKEASLMMPPHSNQSIELFLNESMNNWSSDRAKNENEMQQQSTRQPAGFGIQEVMKTHELMNYRAQCQTEYGILRHNGELITLESEYMFGALKFEITDGECWVFSEDGVLQINGYACNMAQLFVGDQIQWQNNLWVVVGLSILSRAQPVQSIYAQQNALADEDIPEEIYMSHKISLKGHHGVFSLSQFVETEQKKYAVTEEELADFRAKLSTWLDYEPDLKPLQDAELTAAIKSQLKHTQVTPNETQLALLQIGRRANAWRELNESDEDYARLIAQIPRHEPAGRITSHWHNILIISASICSGALLAILAGLLFVI